MPNLRPAIIGAGVMGDAMISALLSIGVEPSAITIREKREERVQELIDKYGVTEGSITGADVLLLAITPQGGPAPLQSMRC